MGVWHSVHFNGYQNAQFSLRCRCVNYCSETSLSCHTDPRPPFSDSSSPDRFDSNDASYASSVQQVQSKWSRRSSNRHGPLRACLMAAPLWGCSACRSKKVQHPVQADRAELRSRIPAVQGVPAVISLLRFSGHAHRPRRSPLRVVRRKHQGQESDSHPIVPSLGNARQVYELALMFHAVALNSRRNGSLSALGALQSREASGRQRDPRCGLFGLGRARRTERLRPAQCSRFWQWSSCPFAAGSTWAARPR